MEPKFDSQLVIEDKRNNIPAPKLEQVTLLIWPASHPAFTWSLMEPNGRLKANERQ